MRKQMPTEFVFSLFALLLAVILVHSIYLTVIRPNADAILAEQKAAMEADPEYIVEPSFYVIMRDAEQEACFVLMLWAFAILGYKGWRARREAQLLQQEFIPIAEGMKILPEDTREYARAIQGLAHDEQRMFLPRVLLSALARFGATRNVQDVSSSTHTLDRQRSRTPGIGVVHDPLYCLGDSVDRLYRHRARYRRRTRRRRTAR